MASIHDASTPPSDAETLNQRPQPQSLVRLLFDHTRIDDAVLNHTYQGKGTAENPYMVNWIPDDAGNPFNWSRLSRWRITMISAVTCFAVAFSSSAYTGTPPASLSTQHQYADPRIKQAPCVSS